MKKKSKQKTPENLQPLLPGIPDIAASLPLRNVNPPDLTPADLVRSNSNLGVPTVYGVPVLDKKSAMPTPSNYGDSVTLEPETPSPKVPNRQRSPGKYLVLTEGKVMVQGDPDNLTVYVPERAPFYTREAADTHALELAKKKPGTPVAVVRFIGNICVQEVTVSKLVRS